MDTGDRESKQIALEFATRLLIFSKKFNTYDVVKDDTGLLAVHNS